MPQDFELSAETGIVSVLHPRAFECVRKAKQRADFRASSSRRLTSRSRPRVLVSLRCRAEHDNHQMEPEYPHHRYFMFGLA